MTFYFYFLGAWLDYHGIQTSFSIHPTYFWLFELFIMCYMLTDFVLFLFVPAGHERSSSAMQIREANQLV
jgi:hypothetical protein